MVTMDTKQLQQQVADLWATRPVRPDDPRTIAGVCGGIAARYRVDPTLVKVAFVVAALFGGSGVLLYLAAWIAFPGAAKARSAAARGRPVHGRMALHNPRIILFVVLAIVIVSSLGPNSTWGSGGVVGAILMLAGWWLLYLRTPTPPPATSVDTQPVAATYTVGSAHPAGAASAGQFERWIPRAMTTPMIPGDHPPTPRPVDVTADEARPSLLKETPAEPTPPAWDPLGTAPFAWDLPEPAPSRDPEPLRDRRSPTTLIVVGLAVLVGAVGTAARQAGIEWFTVGHILACSLAVIGGGLIYAGMRRRSSGRHSSGLVPIAIAVGVATVITTTAAGFSGLPAGGLGDRDWKPLTENDIKSEYTLGGGNMVLDLTKVDLTADRHVTLRNGLGQITVKVGPEMNVRADCSTGVGEYTCPDGLDGGRNGTEGPVLSIDAHTGMGQVEVVR
ncbi:PspC domain-containing protein [Gordonia bronchialis]|uniref:PspC domain-containing protein n=1 Tax=Gordonia bronchialis TaxID=2054 RepID=UPI00243153F1|nr:PspC domain-containing protein [Gordonia bronchialis]